MAEESAVLDELVAMSRRLGDESRDYVILGEGNTSARVDDETFLVKASGTELRTIDRDGFVRVRSAGVLKMLDEGDLTDEQIKDGLAAATITEGDLRPSVETVLHALLLELPGISFVGHTHPTAILSVLCSQGADEAARGRLFPDEIVCCGAASTYVPYVDPGLPLARAVGAEVDRFIGEHNTHPKVTLMQSHGMIALGRTSTEVEMITAMAVKAARALLGTYAIGGPRRLTPANVERIYTRPDEHYRERLLMKDE